MVLQSALYSDQKYDLWMCWNCGTVRALEISDANASAPLNQQKLEDHGLECQACGSKGMEKLQTE